MNNPSPATAPVPELEPLYGILGHSSLTAFFTSPEEYEVKYVLRRDPEVFPVYSVMRYCEEDYRFYCDAYFHNLPEALEYLRRRVTPKEGE